MEKTLHLFRVPNGWTKEQIQEFIEVFKKAEHGIVTRKEVEYIPLIIKENDIFDIERRPL